MTIPPPDHSKGLLSEKEVLEHWRCLSVGGLRVARKNKTIDWISGKRRSAWYYPAAIEKFIQEEMEIRCLDLDKTPYSNSADNGLRKSPVATAITDSGTTREMVERAAQASAQRILKTQNRV
jgi:hypothetical protein